METFQPLINLLVLFSVLSIAAERIANVVKLKDPKLRVSETDKVALTPNAGLEAKQAALEAEKDREEAITWRAILVSIAVAALVKADFFEIMRHLDAPWETLGWVQATGAEWRQSYALNTFGQFAYAMTGSAITGVAMGFGSKFWHDMLDIVFQAREKLKNAARAVP